MEETEIVKTPSAENTPKEPSLRSQNLSVKKESVSPVRLSLTSPSNVSHSRYSQPLLDPPAPSRHSSAASPVMYQPQSSPIVTNNSISSRQTSLRSNRSSKSPAPRYSPTEQINIETVKRSQSPSLKMSPVQNNTVNNSYKSPSIKLSPTKNHVDSRNSSFKSPSLKSSPIQNNTEQMTRGEKSPSPKFTPTKSFDNTTNSSYKSPSLKFSPTKNHVDRRNSSSKSPLLKSSPIQNNMEQMTRDEKSPSPKFTLSDQNDDEPSIDKGNIEKIAKMSKQLTEEANALRNSIKSLSSDIAQTKRELSRKDSFKEDVNFPYHLFLIEMVINKIHMKCECFHIDFNNLVISASFLEKPPIVLYDPSFGKIENISKLNIGKSTLFAMTYDKICSINEFVIVLQLTKQPPCSNCITRIGETHMDYTKEFIRLREELCEKWTKQKPNDDLQCTTAMPLSKNLYYLSCSDSDDHEPIGIIEATVRMSFLGKEITTAYCASSKPQPPSFLLKQDNGMTMYSCQKVEMDDQGKILLDEDVMTKTLPHNVHNRYQYARSQSPVSQISSISRSLEKPMIYHAGLGEFRIRDLNDEINKLMREKRHWEVQIKSLGGPDHARVGPKMLDQDGKEVPGNRGYKYFGAAKDLPGVRELFEQEPPPPARRTRADLMRDVDADYYGYRDDDDGLLQPMEARAEREAIAKAVDEWKRNKEQNQNQELPEEENIYPEDPDDKRADDEDGPVSAVAAHVAVPSQKDVEEALLRRKKQELLERYGCLDVKTEQS